MNRRGLVLSAYALLASRRQAAAASEEPGDPVVERGYIRNRFGQIHLRQAGTGISRTPVICLHLIPNSGQVFTSFLPLLARDRHVVAPDIPGFGMSDPVLGEQTIQAYADGILDMVDALHMSRIDLIGYHTGAAIAAEIANRRRNLVRRVILISVPVFTAEERASFGAQTPIPFDEDGLFAKEEWRRSWRWRGPGQTIESVFRTFAEKMRPGARERGARAVVSYDTGQSVKSITQPMMIVRVRDDLWEATYRAWMVTPSTPLKEIPEYGHGIWDAAPQLMNEMVRTFLDR